MFQSFTYTLLCCAVVIADFVSGHLVDVTNNGPVVEGATIQFKAELFDDNSKPAKGTFLYIWQDVQYPENNATIESTSHISLWNLTCNSKYQPGKYKVYLVVKEKYSLIIKSFTRKIVEKVVPFEVTRMLNGGLVLTQGNVTRSKYVNSAFLLNQTVVLNPPDLEYINSTKNYIHTFWFIDCIYYGQVNGFRYSFNYSSPETKHLVQALVIATSVPMNVTLETPTANVNGSDAKNATENGTAVVTEDGDKQLRDWLATYNKTHPKGNFTYTDKCLSIDDIPLSDNYTFGLYTTNFTVKEPVKVSPINGTSWLKQGEILNITVSCTGSPPFRYCIGFHTGLYNVTGNEKCEEEKLSKNCSFNIQHLFRHSTEYTVVVFLSNSVSHVIKPIAVNIYKVTKHPQLSVIIIPVGFSIVAVILIIFGFAYYVQSKRSYTVEVADFDFANQSSDMEYKSFRERLRESVSNLFLKSNDFNDDEQVWSPTRKYGSMQ